MREEITFQVQGCHYYDIKPVKYLGLCDQSRANDSTLLYEISIFFSKMLILLFYNAA